MKMSGLSRRLIVSGRLAISNYHLIVGALIIGAFTIGPFQAHADDLHYNNILVGDRAAGMGGAYTAISDDPSGLYYNPAGIVFAPGRSFSASVNAYQYSKKTYKDVLGGNGWERVSSNLLPNYFGVIQPLGSGKIGFSYAVPDTRLENQAQTFQNLGTTTRYVINMNDSDYTYNFGPSYAVKLNDRLSVGGTLYMHYRDRQLISNQLQEFQNLTPADYEWRNSYDSTSEWGVKPVVGVMWTPQDKLSLGLTVSKTSMISSSRRIQNTIRYRNDGNHPQYSGITPPLYEVWESADNRQFPWVTTAGAAYFPSESLLVSADLSLYSAESYTLTFKEKSSGAADALRNPKSSTFNAAIGAEYYPNAKIAFRGGLFTNMANTPTLSTGASGQPEHIDMYGISLSASHFTRSSSLTLGGSYSYGLGKSQVLLGSASLQDVEMQNLTAFLSAAFTY